MMSILHIQSIKHLHEVKKARHDDVNIAYSIHKTPPRSKKAVCVRSHAEYFLLNWKIPTEICRWSMLFHKQSIYHIKHMSRLTWNLKFIIEVSILCFIFVHTASLLCMADNDIHILWLESPGVHNLREVTSNLISKSDRVYSPSNVMKCS